MSFHSHVSITRKRTRDETLEDAVVNDRAFTIHDPLTPLKPPRSFQPICLIPRARIPLAYLDPASSGSRLFSACVPLLEDASHEDGDLVVVLVAKSTSEKRLYAIERQTARCYALCRLGDFVKEEMLLDQSSSTLPTSQLQRVKRRALQIPTSEIPQPWWVLAAVELPPAIVDGVSERGARGRSAAAFDMQRSIEPSQIIPMAPNCPDTQASNTNPRHKQSVSDDVNTPDAEILPQESLQGLSRHYLDALYLSRTSLAYFAKGPLSRARAAFSISAKDTQLRTLVVFMRESILTSNVMEKKYRSQIHDVVKAMSLPGDLIQDNKIQKAKRKRRKWMPKRDKAGFFVGEQEFVERWWLAEEIDAGSASSTEELDASLRRRLTRLRIRETLLQIILILEVLALEATAPSQPRAANSVQQPPFASTDGAVEQATTPAPQTKTKKVHHLPNLLEAMLDKLCIWHSLESHSPAKVATVDPRTNADQSNDELKSFCTEVIVPFYNSRIPEYAMIVNKKFGGPSAISPVKGRSVSTQKPGSVKARHPPRTIPSKSEASAPIDTLDQASHVASDRPPLQRTGTDSGTMPSIKREGSEVSLDSIPALKRLAPQRRGSGSVPHLQHFSKREVDLTAISATNEAKMKKKKDVEARVREAVEMLKKPNRALAVKEDELRIDKRFVSATVKKKTKSKQAHSTLLLDAPSAHNVHVNNTPKHRRSKATPRKPPEIAGRRAPESGESTSTTYIVSSSTRLHGDLLWDLPKSTPAIPQTGNRDRLAAQIQETPSRGFAKFMPIGLARLPGTLDSPTATPKTAIFQTPSKPKHSNNAIRSLARPLAAASQNIANQRNVETNRDEGMTESIYHALGWDGEEGENLD